MTAPMDVRLRELRAAAPAFGNLADALSLVLRQVHLVTDAEGECWGHDELGSAFAESYRPAATEVATLFGLLAADSRGVGEAVRLAADNAEASDERAEQRMGV